MCQIFRVTWFFDCWKNDLILVNWCHLKVRISPKLFLRVCTQGQIHPPELGSSASSFSWVGSCRNSTYEPVLLTKFAPPNQFHRNKKKAEVSLTETWMVGTKGCAACIGRNFFPFHTRKQWTAGARPETISTEFAMEGTLIQTSDHAGTRYYRGSPICSHARVTESKVWANFMSFAGLEAPPSHVVQQRGSAHRQQLELVLVQATPVAEGGSIDDLQTAPPSPRRLIKTSCGEGIICKQWRWWWKYDCTWRLETWPNKKQIHSDSFKIFQVQGWMAAII